MLWEEWPIGVGYTRLPGDLAYSREWRIESQSLLQRVAKSPRPSQISMCNPCDARVTYLHDGPSAPAGHDDRLFFLEDDSPDSFGRAAQLPHRNSCLEIPHLDAAIATTTYYPRIIKLQTRDAVIVRGQSMDRLVGCEAPHADGAI